jgi:pilus assembly protein CpaC
MRNFVSRARAVAGIVALAAAVIAAGSAPAAHAGGDRAAASLPAPASLETQHQSILRIRAGDPLPQTRAVAVGRNKSMLVELPRELRDVVVSNPEIMDAVLQSSNRVYLIGKKTGQSNAFFFDANGQQILTLEVLVELDTTPLDQILRRLLPGSNIRSEILNDTVILTGSVRNPVDATRAADIASRYVVFPNSSDDSRNRQKVINMLAVEGEEQVMLRVTVAEVQRSALKQMGVNLGALVTAGQFSTYFLTENALPLTAAAGLGGLPVMAIPTIGSSAGNVLAFNGGPTSPTTAPFGNSGTQSFWGSGNNQLAFAIRALERDGLIRTLAEPNLTAVSGEPASFLAGGEYPIPVVDSQGQLSVTYKKFGVELVFTPIVMSEGRISLKIETSVSELTNIGAVTLSSIQIPALKKREAKSTVELPSGGSIAMAGLISDDVRQNLDGFPGLKDVPVLGTLFRSRDFIRQETELVVIVTPYTVRPTARQNLARPDDGLAPATDRQANFLGHLNRIYGGGGPLPDGGLKGDYGFIVE